MTRYLDEIRIGRDGYAWLISRKGVELYCPVPGHVGKTVQETSGRFPGVIAMAGEMMKGNEGVATYDYDRIRGQRTEVIRKHAVLYPSRNSGELLVRRRYDTRVRCTQEHGCLPEPLVFDHSHPGYDDSPFFLLALQGHDHHP